MKSSLDRSAEETRRDQETAWVAALTTCVSVVAFFVCYRNGGILLYGDAVAHINIARRVLDSRTPGLLQLGTVWLPLPHLLMMPLVASKWMWQSGVGGSLPSMTAYVFGVVGIFRLVRNALSGRSRMGTSVTAGFAAAIYGLNPNLLYLQSTAMTESLYLALFVWAVVYFADFAKALPSNAWAARAKRSLWKCGLCLAAACLTRYDGWFLAALMAAAVIWIGWRAGGAGALRTVTLFVLLAGTAPVLWFAYNAIVYGNALEFANGPYSARAIEKKTSVPGFPPHPGTDNLPMAGLYFLKSAKFSVAEGNWQRVWILVALVGAGFALAHRGLRALLWLWLPVPFYMLSVAYGGVPIFIPTWWPFSLYNIRYGIQLLPALAVFLALAVSYVASLLKAPAGEVGGGRGGSAAGGNQLCRSVARAAGLLSRSLGELADTPSVGTIAGRPVTKPSSERDAAHVSRGARGRACRMRAFRSSARSTKAITGCGSSLPIPTGFGSKRWPIRRSSRILPWPLKAIQCGTQCMRAACPR